MAEVKPVKRSVSVAILNGDRVLIVQRPDDDEDLPNAWGLPAASLRDSETWEDAVIRAGREKLGVELRVGDVLEEGTLSRERYTLQMKLFEANITSGEPSVLQGESDVTQYQAWKWGSASELEPAAEQGSLCCKLFLAYARA
jgi:ADP-ribose pyrophosphatase YjhB (NUDIX family)